MVQPYKRCQNQGHVKQNFTEHPYRSILCRHNSTQNGFFCKIRSHVCKITTSIIITVINVIITIYTFKAHFYKTTSS